MALKKVLLIGSGGREHALAWKLAQSPKVGKLYVAPGNGGTLACAENVPITVTDFSALIKFALENKIDLVVVAPDDPLALGLVDELEKAGLKAFGPKKTAAQIEASKAFSKNFMKKYNIPTAKFGVFKDFNLASQYLKEVGAPIVIKASGLALGKGVFVCQTMAEAESALREIMENKIFGQAGDEVVIEEYLEGQEISIHVFSDGESYKIFPTAQDHKPVFDKDLGPNTGGMGTIAPLPWFKLEMMAEIENKIVRPTLAGMKNEGRTFKGLLYPGLKMTTLGPKVLEFNARFGDPETQSYMRLLKTDLFDILEACANGTLAKCEVEWNQSFAACIVMASGGYPGKYEKGLAITGIDKAESMSGVKVFHAGTSLKDGKLVTSGGRVLGVTATGDTLKQAQGLAYEAVGQIKFKGMQYRKDIGAKALVK
jgi:phosphoribosylamine---glycine ligase